MSEFGADGISDMATLHRILPKATLDKGVDGIGDQYWDFHRGGLAGKSSLWQPSWLSADFFEPLFAARGSLAPTTGHLQLNTTFNTIEQVVRASQYVQ